MRLLWLWRKELVYLVLFISIAAIFSYFWGYFIHMVVFILVMALVYQAFLVAKLEQWLKQGALGKAPISIGAWSDVYQHFVNIKKAEKKRKKMLGNIIDRFRQSTDVLPDAAIVIGGEGEVEWSNKSAKLVLGVKKSDRGQYIENLIFSSKFALFLKNKDEKSVFSMSSPVDDKIILQFKVVRYGINQQLIIAQDVTQQKNIEAMRKNFVDNISHELRTPLTVLKGYLETLQEMDDEQSAIVTQSLQQMSEQTERMQYLVDDLLLLARLESKKTESHRVDVAKLVKSICLDSSIIKENKSRIELVLASEVDIIGVEQDLRSAFTNLIVNALNYSAKSSSVKVTWKQMADKMVFEVSDQGEGIAESEIPKITSRFYRVNTARLKKMGGTGLGLAIVKHVMIGHGATLKIKSRIGKGSQFSCIFSNNKVFSY